MNRRYVVLRQFQTDLSRLIAAVEEGYGKMSAQTPSPDEVMRIYRPVHSLKGLCTMVDEGKDLAKIFHVLEDTLSEMLPVGEKHRKKVQGWRDLVVKAVEFARATETFVDQKVKLWERFGAHENENRGLVISLDLEGKERKLWVPITSLSGHFADPAEKSFPETWIRVGEGTAAHEALLVEFPGSSVLVYARQIDSISTRLEAIQLGVALSLKDFLSEHFRSAA